MKSQFIYVIFAALLAASCGLSRGDAPDPFSEQPFAGFIDTLNDFSAQPTAPKLRDLELRAVRLPVRDMKPGQIGEGHPFDRDAKLRCMLRFLAAMDRLVVDHLPTAYLNVAVAGVPTSGMNPGDVQDPVVRDKYIAAIKANNEAIQVVNFQTRLQRTRQVWVRHYLPTFITRDCRAMPAEQLQHTITDELKDDARAKDAVASLSQAAAAR